MTDTTPTWAIDLAHKLLNEAPENLPFWQIMANAIADERERCASKAYDAWATEDWNDIEEETRVTCRAVANAIRSGK